MREDSSLNQCNWRLDSCKNMPPRRGRTLVVISDDNRVIRTDYFTGDLRPCIVAGMRPSILSWVLPALLVGSAHSETPAPWPATNNNMLVISKTAGYRHQAIPTGVKTLVELAQTEKWRITATEDTSLITSDFLKHFNLLVFLHTTKNIFSNEQKAATVKRSWPTISRSSSFCRAAL